jgi:hypothetical protein
MKSTLLKLAMFAVLLFAALAIQMALHQESEAKLRDEIQALRQQLELRARSMAPAPRPDSALDQPGAQPDLNPDQQLSELLQLRGKAAQLVEKEKELAALREENRQLRAASLRAATAGLESGQGATNRPQPLDTRIIRVEVGLLVQNLKRYTTPREGEANTETLRRFLQENGVDLTPPATLFLNEIQGTLTVRNTQGNLDKLEALLAMLSSAK